MKPQDVAIAAGAQTKTRTSNGGDPHMAKLDEVCTRLTALESVVGDLVSIIEDLDEHLQGALSLSHGDTDIRWGNS